MKHQISRISIWQTTKIATILYAFVGLILVPFGCVFLLVPNPTNNPSLRIIGVTYLFGPILEGVFGLIFTAIGCWLYNIIAARVGGIEFELKEVPSSTTS